MMHVSVIGGGISGASIASALSKCPNIIVNVYEAGSAIREAGAAIGFGINAQKALTMIDPALSRALFDASGGAADGYMRHFIGQGDDAGKWVMDVATNFPPVAHVPRAAFLTNMWNTIPEGVLQLNKKLKSVKPQPMGHGYTILFEDNSIVETDAIIGCDGIHSSVRGLVLEAHPHVIKPVWAGFWDVQKLLPIEKAWEMLGTKESYQNPADVRTNCIAGNPGFLLFGQIAPAQLAVCVACGRTGQESPYRGQPFVTLTQEFLQPYLSGFGDLGNSVMRLLLDDDDPKAYFEWESAEAPFYHKEQMCIIGDAAHASTPWLGSGAAMAIEDAMLLGRLFSKVKTPVQITDAFEVFTQLRLVRTQKVVIGSRKNGELMCGKQGLDLQFLKREDAIVGSMDWIYDFDLEQHAEEAVEMLAARINA